MGNVECEDNQVSSQRRVEVLDSMAGFESLACAWERIQDAPPCAPFYMLRECWRAYLDSFEENPDKMKFLVLSQDGSPHGIVPLRPEIEMRRGLTIRVWSVPRCTQSHMTDVLLMPGERFESWWPLVRKAMDAACCGWHALHIPMLPHDGAAIRDGQSFAGHAIFRPEGHTCHLDTTLDHATLSSRYRGQLRGSLKRGCKGLDALGDLGVWSARTPAEFAQGFETFVKLEASGWKAETGAVAVNAAKHSYLKRIFVGGRLNGQAEIHVLHAGDKPVAAQLCVLRAGTRSILKVAHDDSLRKFSPGSVLMDRIVKRTCDARDASVFSFVTGLDWHQLWGPKSRTTGNLWLFRSALIAGVARQALRWKDKRETPAAASRAQKTGNELPPCAHTRPAHQGDISPRS